MHHSPNERNQSHRSRILSLSKSWTLWEWWVLATVVGACVGFGIIAVVYQAIAPVGMNGVVPVLHLVGIVEGATLGFAQWLVLRRYIKHVGGWLVATTIAVLLAWLVGVQVSVVLAVAFFGGTPSEAKTLALQEGVFLLGAWVGSVIGLAQWFILKHHLHKAAVWVFANAVAWAMAMEVAFMSAGRMKLDGFNLETVWTTTATGISIGAVVGSITGVALVGLLKPRLRQRN